MQNLHLIRLVQWLFILLLFVIGLAVLHLLNAMRFSYMIYAILYIVSIGLMISSFFVMADLLLSILIALIVYYGIRFEFFKRKSHFSVIIAIWSVTLLLKPVMLVSLIAIPLIALRYRRLLGSSISYLLAPLLAAAIVFGINFKTTGLIHYSSISSINMSYYNAKLLIANEYGYDSAQKYTQASIFETPRNSDDYRNYLKALNSRAKESIVKHPNSYSKIHIIGMLKSLLDPGRFELSHLLKSAESNMSLTEQLIAGNWDFIYKKMKSSPGFIALFLVLLLFSLIKLAGLLLAAFSKNNINWFLLLITGYFIFLAGPIGAFRFTMPAFIPYLILGTLGLEKLFLLFQKGSKSQDILAK
ncbi:MAG: hypothetical protein JXR19_05490 [Bacteroidia bacterium]